MIKNPNPIIYPAKVLFFGEYAVVKGGQATALPIETFSGHWHKINSTIQPEWSNWLQYLTENCVDFLNVTALQAALQEGWEFLSTIPRGYGMGSSGAVVAAVYEAFCKEQWEQNDLAIIKSRLGLMESHFHGSSSGLDPLVSLVRQPLVITGKIIEVKPQFHFENQPEYGWYLFDSGIARETAPLVNIFLQKCEIAAFEARIFNELIPLNEDAIHLFYSNKAASLFKTVHEISHFQWQFFGEMIPSALRNIWLEGLASDEYKMKLCGAGGGGFALCFAKKESSFVKNQQNLISIL